LTPEKLPVITAHKINGVFEGNYFFMNPEGEEYGLIFSQKKLF
jgi:hypothetical protein